MNKIINKVFLYTGLFLLLIAILIKWQEAPFMYWFPTFVTAILLKTIFLFNVFHSGDFKMSLWLILIIIGVVMILISLIFKFVYHIPLLRDILFYGAITLKISGLILMIAEKVKSAK